MGTFQAVIFDWDGTLADTRQVLVSSFQRVLQDIGCRVDDAFIERRIGVGPRLIFQDALQHCSFVYNARRLTELEQRKIRIQITKLDDIHLFDGAIDLLQALKGRVKIALATMSNKLVIARTLKQRGVKDYFTVVVTFDDVTRSKPDPEVFLRCAAQLNCQPEQCVVIEDSIFGVAAAKHANMSCIAVASGMYSREELMREEPDLIVDAISERVKILQFIT